MSKSKAKGTSAESALVSYLRGLGYSAERRALTGKDQGDISWHDFPWVATEVKSVRTPDYGGWLREAEEERVNAGAEVGIVVHKPHGVGLTSQGDWRVVLTLDQFISLLERTKDYRRDQAD